MQRSLISQCCVAEGAGADAALDRVMERGGFPEPFLAENPEDALVEGDAGARFENACAAMFLRQEEQRGRVEIRKAADVLAELAA